MRESAIEFLSSALPDWKHIIETVMFQNTLSLVALACAIAVELASERISLLFLRLGRTCFGAMLIYTIPVLLFTGTSFKHMSKSSISMARVALLLFTFGFGIVVTFV